MIESLQYNPDFLVKVDLKPFGVPYSDFYIYLDYLNHPQLSGNKLRKLYGHINWLKSESIDTMITIGGNQSNYLYACSFIPELTGIKVIAIVKGHQPRKYGLTLRSLDEKKDIQIIFYTADEINYQMYTLIDELKKIHTNSHFIEEGASGACAYDGFEYLIKDHFDDVGLICVPVGTSSTLNGIHKHKHTNTQVMGYAPHRDFMMSPYDINYDYHFGGFAKMKPELYDFILKFYELTKIPLDPIYTSKMVYGIIEDIKKREILPYQKIVAIHTGGLNGWDGMKEKWKFEFSI